MNTGLKPTGIIERKDNPDNKIEYNSKFNENKNNTS